VVGKTSGVYKQTTANALEIPHFPIMLNVIRMETSDTSPTNHTVTLSDKNSSGDEIANVNFFTTSHM